jgi:hypothetical protein
MLVLSTAIVSLNFEDTTFKIVNGLGMVITICDQFIGLFKAISLKNGYGKYSKKGSTYWKKLKFNLQDLINFFPQT